MPLETHDTIWTLTGYKMILKPLSILPLKKKKKLLGGAVPVCYPRVTGTVWSAQGVNFMGICFFIDSCLLKPMIQFGL